MTNEFQPRGFLIWGICALFFFYEFFLRVLPGSFQSAIMHDLQLSNMAFSTLSTTVFLLVYGLMQMPVGVIAEHWGLKKSLFMGVMVCSLSSLGIAWSTSFWPALFCRLVMGFGASFGFICLLVSVTEWMPARHRALFIGLSQFLGTLGPILATGPLLALTQKMALSWQSVFEILSIIGVIIALLVFIFVENNTERKGVFSIIHLPEGWRQSLAVIFKKSQPLWIAWLSFCLYFIIEYLTENEGLYFLKLKNDQMSELYAGQLLSLAWWSYAISSPLWGWISDRFKRRKLPLQISAIFLVISMTIWVYGVDMQLLLLAMVLLGVGASGQTVGFALMADQLSHRYIAMGYGLNNAVITFVAAINAPALGGLLEIIKQGEMPSYVDYQWVFHALIAFALMALWVSSFKIKETFCKTQSGLTVLNLSKNAG
ncbi:MAG: MFS transporter [Candidatus Comchoanobacterales bacterium]